MKQIVMAANVTAHQSMQRLKHLSANCSPKTQFGTKNSMLRTHFARVTVPK